MTGGENLAVPSLASNRARGTAIRFASPDLAEALRLAHRIIVFFDGRIASETHSSVATEEKIVQMSTRAAVRLRPLGESEPATLDESERTA
jgi:ABC-type uncharacterized transport system ATPase subunit